LKSNYYFPYNTGHTGNPTDMMPFHDISDKKLDSSMVWRQNCMVTLVCASATN